MTLLRKPMLAVKVEITDFENLRFPLLVSPKIDGIRATVTDGEFRSRSGKTFPNKHIATMFDKVTMDLLIKDFDGEFVVGNPNDPNVMQATQSVTSSLEKPIDDLKYCVFDIVTSDEAITRYEKYVSILKAHQHMKNIIIVEKIIVDNIEELQAFEANCLADGYEGIMGQSLDGLYKHGRSTLKSQQLLKFKQFSDSEAEIIGFEELMRNDNVATEDAYGHTDRQSLKENLTPMNTLGAFLARDVISGVEFKIGTGRGLTLELRKEIWDARDTYMNKLVKYSFFSQGQVEKPRFPVWLGFRDSYDMGE